MERKKARDDWSLCPASFIFSFFKSGEVVIQRLNWQKIVTFPSPGENVKVRGLSWQHDETIVAVGVYCVADID